MSLDFEAIPYSELLETVFVIAICCLSDYKQQSEILLLTIFNNVRR